MKNFSSRYSFNAAVNEYNYSIMTPESSAVSVSSDVNFIYAMRKDSESVCNLLASQLSFKCQIRQDRLQNVLRPLYGRFVDELAHIIGRNFLCKGKTQIHLFDPDVIESHQLSYLGERQAISLDPLIQGYGIETIGMSRGYLLGGVIEVGMKPRPGFPSLHEQILAIKEKITLKDGVDIFEDDIYTGGSLTRIVDMLAIEGIKVKRIIPGIQIGTPQSLIDRGIEIIPAIQYHLKEGQNIDLGDPRDFLLGADGLVIMLNGSQSGRLPYITPFVSPSARLSIPKENEENFSRDVLGLNRQFFHEIEKSLNIHLELKHMNKTSAFALVTLMPEWKNSRMIDIVDCILDQDNKVKSACKYHKDRSVIKMMDLPSKMVFLDVNGTILSANSKDGHIDDDVLRDFQEAVSELKNEGMVVGLNSDSPLRQLQDFASKIGISDAPIIAENGSIAAYKDKKFDMRNFDGLENLKAKIIDLAEEYGFSQAEDIIAPEFGGGSLAVGKWAFGGNRTNSLSVFAKGDFLEKIRKLVDENYSSEGFSCDFSPEHGFLGVHSCENFRKGKAKTLEKLVREGHQIISIGDSLSDYASFSLPNRVVFVQYGIDMDILSQSHVSVSKQKGILGVIETLKNLVNEQRELSVKQGLTYDI